MRRMVTIIIAVSCLISPAVYASESEGIIAGTVIEDRTSEPISSATVALLNREDSTIMASTASGSDGIFELSHVPFGEYDLKITSLGHESKTIESIEISEQINNVNLGVILLVEAAEFQLDEITVAGDRLKGEEKIDRTVYTINDDIRKICMSGLDILKHLPSVTVDFRENVTLEGRSNIRFYVDDIKRNKDFVAQLDPQKIDKVELITNPSVKYDSDIYGIINIVLKKEERAGINGSITIPITNPDKALADPAGNIEYGYNSYRLYAGGRMHYERFERDDYFVSEWNGSSDDQRRLEKDTKGALKYRYNYINYGFDWFIDNKTSINFLGEWTTWRFKAKENIIENRLYLNNILDQYYETDMNGLNSNGNNYFSMFFKRELEKEGSEFTAEMYYSRQSGESGNEYIDNYYDKADLKTITDIAARKDLTDNLRKTSQLKLDYSFVSNNIKNEIGTRSFAGWTDNDFFYNSEQANQSDEYTDSFSYDERRQQVYYNATGKLNAFDWQAGLAGEYSSLNINRTDNIDNFIFLPQASLKRELAENSNIKFSFRRKIQRPDPYKMYPFETWTDPLHVRKGNPDLDPAFENNFELTYSKNFDSNFLSPKLYLRHTDNAIQEYTAIRDDGVSETTYKNIGKDLEYGIGLTTSLNIKKWWQLSGNISLYETCIRSEQALNHETEQDQTSWRFNLSITFILPRDFSVFAWAQYNSPYITYQRKNYRDMLFFFGVVKKFSKNMSIEAFYLPFVEYFTYSKSIIESPGYYEKNIGTIDARNFISITFKYNFNYGKEIKKIERSIEYEKGEGSGAL